MAVMPLETPEQTDPSASGGRWIKLCEVAQHNTMDDAWTVIDNHVYDITDWAKKHPGGNLIRLAAGRYSTVQ